MRSLICEFIANNLDWQQKINELGIRIKFDSELDPYFAIFNYGIGVDFSNPIVQEARGIIIDLHRLVPVAWSFRKFGNYHESYVDTIDWTTARVQDKLDGSIVRTWYNPYVEAWQWSTNSCINAKDAELSSSLKHQNFLQLIKIAENYNDIDFDKLNKNYTYTFELVGPENQIVVKYDKTYLWHIGTRDNITGEELVIDIGIEHPHEYNVHSFEDCLKAAESLNNNDIVDYEGFVVVDNNWHRIKVKNPTYLFFHHFTNGAILNKSIVIDFIRSDDCDVDTLVENFKQYESVIRFYANQIEQLEIDVQTFIDNTRELYKQLNYDRKAIALHIKSHKFAMFGFNALNSNKTARELLDSCYKKTYESFIEDYIE